MLCFHKTFDDRLKLQIIHNNIYFSPRLGEFPSVYVDNHEYHHVCVLWNWLTQEARVYRDGLLISSFAGVQFPGTPASKY